MGEHIWNAVGASVGGVMLAVIFILGYFFYEYWLLVVIKYPNVVLCLSPTREYLDIGSQVVFNSKVEYSDKNQLL